MIKKTALLLLSIMFLFQNVSKADEGMWIPLLLKKYNIEAMRAKGFKLTAEDIYSINKASMKDAVLIFGGGCTGEVISDQGLVLTNHHCGFSAVQYHSSLEHNYLTDGFWAMTKKEELATPFLSVKFLVRMENVTEQVMVDITDATPEKERQSKIKSAIYKITKKAEKGTHYKAIVKPFFAGNEYYLFVQEVFTDIRMVGAPPSAIGKFGGDTDNWMWPRHTGDFSVFRIYANKDNKPAKYSVDNVPYKPKKHFPISMKGVQKGDFTLIFGFPGRTQEYLTSYAVRMISEVQNPHRIKIRQMKINQMQQDMDASPAVRIQYASKYARVSNYWKKWIGENHGLKRLNAIAVKEQQEADFVKWIGNNPDRKQKYGHLLPEYKKIYTELSPYMLAVDYFSEAAFSLEIMQMARRLVKLSKVDNKTTDETIQRLVDEIRRGNKRLFKDYNMPTDKAIFIKAMKIYFENSDPKFYPKTAELIQNKFKGDFDKYAKYLFSKTIINKPEKLEALLSNFSAKSTKKIKKDPAFILYTDFLDMYLEVINPKKTALNAQIEKLNRIWMQSLREMHADKVLYPDANFTLRVAYGQVDDYFPRNAVHYTPFTTLAGIIEKDNPDIYDYRVPKRLKELYKNKDYGQYGQNGEMPVCFTASNHTTGGNSGSPVINGNGELIGINFDRNWEGTMSDIMYDPEQCRNISVDIRYVLFIIDKFANAGHLIEEMTLVR